MYANSGTRTNVVCFRIVLLSRVNCLGYAQEQFFRLSSLTADLASLMPLKINEVNVLISN